jgi:pilus assembly protein CpaC
LANPSLLMVDGERSFILLGNKYLYPKQNGQTATGQPTYDTAELKTGVYLQLAVHLDQEGNVLLTAYPQNSYVSGNQAYSNGVTYPIVSTREAQTTVRLRNGEMMAIGGLKQDYDLAQTGRIPWLGAIPVLGALFGTRTRNKNRGELVIFIQPELQEPDDTRPSVIRQRP